MTKRERQSREYAEEARRDREARDRILCDVAKVFNVCPYDIARALGILPPISQLAEKKLEDWKCSRSKK